MASTATVSIWFERRANVILIAASAKGICALLLGDDEASTLEEFSTRFPDLPYDLAEKPTPTIRAALAAIDGGRTPPLDLKGTPFQLMVWDALRAIPRGKVLSYAELARAIGRPKSFRAVAQACGANPVAILVPCHRIVASDGSLGGYRWGTERKRRLLEAEKLSAHP